MKVLKGISLPVNFIVILAVAVVVMLIVVILMTGVITPLPVNDVQAWTIGCERLIQRGCRADDVRNIVITGYDPNGDGQWDNLLTACQRRLGRDYDDQRCRDACCSPPGRETVTT